MLIFITGLYVLYPGTPLHCAVEVNNLDLVNMFLLAKADVEALRKGHLQTPLMLACQLGHVTIAQRLLAADADINRQTEECSSALTLACHFGHYDMVNAMIGRISSIKNYNYIHEDSFCSRSVCCQRLYSLYSSLVIQEWRRRCTLMFARWRAHVRNYNNNICFRRWPSINLIQLLARLSLKTL